MGLSLYIKAGHLETGIIIILYHNHAVSNGFTISVGVVGTIVVMVFLVSMVTIGGIKFRQRYNIKFTFIKKKE